MFFDETVPRWGKVGRGGFMRRFLTLICLLFLTIPAGITISGCYRNPAGNYCNGLGYGLKVTEVATIALQPSTTGVSLAFGQTRQVSTPVAATCKGTTASVSSYAYGTTNNKLVDISPSGNICAGTWNRNSGGGIADYTICNYPNPLPNTGGLPYSVGYITAAANSVTSNPVAVYVHSQVSSISLVGPQQCLSQGQLAQLDAQACYSSNGTQVLMCAPSTVTSANYACPLAPGVTSVPNCSQAIGTLAYTPGTATVATINAITNQITAQNPGTTVITASIAGSGSAAGYFSTCPPQSILLTLNGGTSGTVTQGVPQNLVTQVIDTNGNPISGLSLDYQSTNPLDINVGTSGAISPSFPGAASIYAICQPATCNAAPINKVGQFGTGLSISSNAVDVTTPGTASSYVWYAAPGQSQYFVPVELLSGTLGSTVRLPYVPNSMIMDRTGSSLYFGSSHELMVYSTANNSLTTQNPNVPGVVLAVAPNNSAVLINDQVRKVFYLFNANSSTAAPITFGGLGNAAQWTPDSKTLYVTDSSALGNGHTDTLYVYNANTGWTTYALPPASGSNGALNLAITIPGIGTYVSGQPTVAHTWCPMGTLGDYNTMVFYPEGDSVPVRTDALAATTDGMHILGAASSGGGATFTDIGVTIPTSACAETTGGILNALTIPHTINVNQAALSINATAINQVITSPSAVSQGTGVAATNVSFITYAGTTPGATLPYYEQPTGSSTTAGTINYLTLTGGSAITAPIAGAFSPDNTLFFVSTAGDNLIHYINTSTLTDTQQINPNLPACVPGSDPGCLITTPVSGSVPASTIAVKPRATT
jgi:trimeric autotransporter adhesin